MLKSAITVEDVITLLNEAVALDRPAMAALLANRVPCTAALADHSTIQVQAQHGGYHVGLLGIINGIFGIDDDGKGPICYVFTDGQLQRFAKTPANYGSSN